LFAKEAVDHGFAMTGVSGRCIDARGQKWKVTQEGNDFFLIKGRIWTSGGVLFREGKSGIAGRSVVQFEKDTVSEMLCCTCYAFTSACCGWFVQCCFSSAIFHEVMRFQPEEEEALEKWKVVLVQSTSCFRKPSAQQRASQIFAAYAVHFVFSFFKSGLLGSGGSGPI
jgi:hypothetical protein